jgi:hypothetical protein
LNVITIGLLICLILYLAWQHWQTRQVIRWWQKRQADWRYRESERLRDNVLQSLFGIRRQLELMSSQDNQAADELAQTIQECQVELNHLSDRLFSTYAVESLPLAIHELFDEMKTLFPKVQFGMQGELDLDTSAYGDGHFLIIWLRELFQAVLTKAEVRAVAIDISAPKATQHIAVRVNFSCDDQLACSKLHQLITLNYLCQTFNLVTGGRCYVEAGHAGTGHAENQAMALVCSVVLAPPNLWTMPTASILGRYHDQVSDFSH